MISRPNNYDNTKEYGGGFKTLPAGGYVCSILKAEETQSKKGAPMLKIALDIAEGEYAGYFMELFRKRKEEHPMDAKYPNNGIAYIMVEDQNGQCHRGFKSFCGALEKCGYTVWGAQNEFLTNDLKGKKVGVTFGREEYEWNGKTGWSTKPRFFCTVEDINNENFSVPNDRPLQRSTNPVDEMIPPGFEAIDDEDQLPF